MIGLYIMPKITRANAALYGIYNSGNLSTLQEHLAHNPKLEEAFLRRKELFDEIELLLEENISHPSPGSNLFNWLYNLISPTETRLANAVSEYNEVNTRIKKVWSAYKPLQSLDSQNARLQSLDSNFDFYQIRLPHVIEKQIVNAPHHPDNSTLRLIATSLGNNTLGENWEEIIENLETKDYLTQQFVRKIYILNSMTPQETLRLSNPFPKVTPTKTQTYGVQFLFDLLYNLFSGVAPQSSATNSNQYERLKTDLENQLDDLKIQTPTEHKKEHETLDKYLVAKSMEECLAGRLSWYEVCEISAEHPAWKLTEHDDSSHEEAPLEKNKPRLFSRLGHTKKMAGAYFSPEKGFSLTTLLVTNSASLPQSLQTISALHEKLTQCMQTEQLKQQQTPSTEKNIVLLKQIAAQLRTILITPNPVQLKDIYAPAFTQIAQCISQMTDTDISASLEKEVSTLKNTAFGNIEIKGLSAYVIRKNEEANSIEQSRKVVQRQ